MYVMLLISLTVTLVSATSNPLQRRRTQVLKEMHVTLNNISALKVKKQQVLNVFDKDCKPEYFCKTEKILSKLHQSEFGRTGVIVRLLEVFNDLEGTKCTLQATGNTVELGLLLNHLHSCVKKLLS
ncbi:hypothetical protein GN956_G23327 [Arapaima gigas]